MSCFEDLLRESDGKHAPALFDCVRDFSDWGVTDLEPYTWFMTEAEWSWMCGQTSMEDG